MGGSDDSGCETDREGRICIALGGCDVGGAAEEGRGSTVVGCALVGVEEDTEGKEAVEGSAGVEGVRGVMLLADRDGPSFDATMADLFRKRLYSYFPAKRSSKGGVDTARRDTYLECTAQVRCPVLNLWR